MLGPVAACWGSAMKNGDGLEAWRWLCACLGLALAAVAQAAEVRTYDVPPGARVAVT